MKVNYEKYDFAKTLVDDECICLFIQDAFDSDDPLYLARAIRIVVDIKGIGNIEQGTGISEEELERSFQEGEEMKFSTALAIFYALGIEVTVAFRQR